MNSEDFERYYEEYLNALKSWGLLKTYTNFDWTLFLYKARKHGLKHNMLFDFDVVYQNDSAILMVWAYKYPHLLLIWVLILD